MNYKYILYSLLILLALSCKNKDKHETELVLVENNYDWLLGKWKRINKDSLKQTFEIWTKTNDSYFGHGYILELNDTVWQERMTLNKRNDIWQLKVKTPGENDTVIFKQTQFNDTLFTVENLKHDFPKKIIYWKNNNLLNAEVSSEEATIDFEFEKIN